jgi:4-amino-4-deoxy-L-arabinose transferase-like glycosyltransferase
VTTSKEKTLTDAPRGRRHDTPPPRRYAQAVVAKNRALFLLLGLALALRIGWVSLQGADPDPRLGDQSEYLQLGRNLLAAHELKLHDARFDQDVYAYRTPGYPVLIAACGGNVRAIRLVQAILDTSTVLAIYLLARRYVSPGATLAAAAFVAFNPFLVYFTALVLTETLFVAMLAWGMCLLAVRRRNFTLGGIALLAISIHVRPSALGLVVLLAGAAGWQCCPRTGVRNAILAAVATLLVLLPWGYRNAHHPQVRAWVFTTTNSGITTYDGFHDRATGASDQQGFVAEMQTLLSRMDEVERNEYLSQRAHQWIRSHPGRAAALMVNKIARTWSPVPLSNDYGGRMLYVAAGLLYSVPFDLFVLLGLWKSALPRTAKVFLLLPAIYFTVIHALSVGSLRYRVPVEPPMAVIAGYALVALAVSALPTKHGPTHGPSRRKSG